jgi:hypothetical protein
MYAFRISSVVMCGMFFVSLSAQAAPPVTDAQRFAMYQECTAHQHTSVLQVVTGVLDFAAVVADVATEDPTGFLTDVAAEFTARVRDKGCEGFLSDAQIKAAAAAQHRQEMDQQNRDANQAIHSR